MIFLDNLYVEIILLAIALCWIGFWCVVIKNRNDMKSSEESFQEISVMPAGSGLSHGMIRNKEKRVGVVRDSQKSDNWFKRLL